MATTSKTKSKTGMEEMLGKLFGSPGMTETMERIDRVQATTPEPPTLSIVVPTATVKSVQAEAPAPKIDPVSVAPAEAPPVETAPVEVKAALPSSVDIEQSTEQSSKQSNKQTGSRAKTIAINQANNQTIKQTDNQANNEASSRAEGQTTDQAIKQSIQQFTEQSDKQPSSQSVEQSTEQTDKQSVEQPIQQSIEHSIEQSSRQPVKQSLKQIYLPLNENQGRILLFLYEHGQGLTNMEIICAETGIAYGTARTAIDVLMKEGYVTSKERHNGHSFKGFEYTLNNHLCSLYATRVRGEQSTEQSPWQFIQHSSKQSNRQSINQAVAPFSSRSLDDIKTTTTHDDFLKDPELGYWKEKGVTSRQVEKWAEEFSMDVDQVLLSLKHCRYEMVMLNHEEEKQISNPMNWFYKVMQRSGFYPRPAEYKSMAELRAEQMEQATREMIEARKRQIVAEAELAFQKILADPTGNDYQALLAQVDSFARDMGGKALETALREAFLKERGQ